MRKKEIKQSSHQSNDDGWSGPPGMKKRTVKCSNPECGREFSQTEYMALFDTIVKSKPTCSFNCNKKVGQVK